MHSVRHCCFEDAPCNTKPTHRITVGFEIRPSEGHMGLLYCKPHAKVTRDKQRAWYRWNARVPGAMRPNA